MGDAEERERTALHEAGHAAVSYLCGFAGAGPVSIVPGKSYRGVCISGHVRRPSGREMETWGRPVPLQAAGLRRYRELAIMVLLGGLVAEETFRWAATGRGAESPEATVEAVMFRLALPELAPAGQPPEAPGEARPVAAGLPRREAELLAAAAADDLESDAGQIARVLALTHPLSPGGATASAYLRWLCAETRDMIRDPAGLAMVRALSAALLEAGTLSAAEWRGVCRAAS